MSLLPRVAGALHGEAFAALTGALQVLSVEERFSAAARRAKGSKRCHAKL